MSAYSPAADNADAPRTVFDGREEHPAPYIQNRWATLSIWAVIAILASSMAYFLSAQTARIEQSSGAFYAVLAGSVTLNMAMSYIFTVGPARAFLTKGGFLDSLRFLVSKDSLAAFLGHLLFLFFMLVISITALPSPGVISGLQILVSIFAVASGLMLVARNQRMTYCLSNEDYTVLRAEKELMGPFRRTLYRYFGSGKSPWPVGAALFASAFVPVLVQDLTIGLMGGVFTPVASALATISTLLTISVWVYWLEWGSWTRLFLRRTTRSLTRTQHLTV